MAWVSAFYAFEGTLEPASGGDGLEKQYLVMYPLFLDFIVKNTNRARIGKLTRCLGVGGNQFVLTRRRNISDLFTSYTQF